MKCYVKRFIILFAGVFGVAYGAQSQNRSYFPHKIIIKYKSDTQLQLLATGKAAQSKQQAQRLLNKVGITSKIPVWHFNNRLPFPQKSIQSAKTEADIQSLKRIYELSYSSGADPAVLAAKLSALPAIAYAEPLYLRKMQFVPNDPIQNPYRDVHRFKEAWDVTKGSPNVIVAIVDGGVNYLHPDLDGKLWINTDEIPSAIRTQIDANADGTVTSVEVMKYLNRQNGDYNNDGAITLADALAKGSPLLSHSDTDGNGLEDDIFGWDYWQSGGVNGQPVTQDNNPILDATDHGTHIAGIAAAETNNGAGLAGTGFNVRYMAIKAGGIPDDPSTTTDESQLIGFGFEGIMYAAMQGADVINCSWGGGAYSDFENDVVNFATDMGSLVVAAAGNDGVDNVDYPSGYANTLSVGSIGSGERISSFSNEGYKVDVFATGENIQSTSYNSDIVSKSGTSMSTPVVSGLAGLVKSQHPNWPARRVGAQIRSSSAFIDRSDPRQGHGKVDAYRAVTTDLPGVRILSANFEDSQGAKLGLNENGIIHVELINYGKATTNLTLQLQSLVGQEITLNQPLKNIGSLSNGDSTAVEFGITINETYNLDTVPAFRLNFTDNNQNYTDFDVLQYSDILYDVVDANNIKMSFAGDGTIGFTNPFAGKGGVGFVPQTSGVEGKNLLFEGGLMLEANGAIFDVVRGTGDTVTKDFTPRQTFIVDKKGTVSAQDGHTTFTFGDTTGAVAGRIRLQTYSFDKPGLRNVVFLKYSITNTSSILPLKDIYVGLFNDWDLGQNVSDNSVDYSQQDSILYISDNDDSDNLPLVAVAHLGTISSALAINNFPATPPANPAIDLNDGFDDTEKKASLKAGTARTQVQSADVSAVTASGPYILNPNSTLTVGFVYAFGDDLNELRAQIAEARKQMPFSVSPTGVVISDRIPDTTNLLQNYPNPFTDQTTIRLDLSKTANVKLTLYDVLGRKIEVLRDEKMDAKEYFIPFTPKNISSGIYYLRLQTDNQTKTVPITYIK